MLLKKSVVLMLALAGVTAMVATVPAAPSNDCQTSLSLDPVNGRVGRPCVTVQSTDPACFPAGTFNPNWPAKVCTFYVFLVPFSNGAVLPPPNPTPGWVDHALIWGETNGAAGLQKTVTDGTQPDKIFLL